MSESWDVSAAPLSAGTSCILPYSAAQPQAQVLYAHTHTRTRAPAHTRTRAHAHARVAGTMPICEKYGIEFSD